MVAPSRGRGLKPKGSKEEDHEQQVAPSRGRGLKPRCSDQTIGRAEVAPSRGRGLKRARPAEQVLEPRSPPHGGVD